MTATKGLLARASITIEAAPDAIWHALTDTEVIRKYMFGSTVESGWRVGDRITFKGEWKGQAYEDKGTIRRAEPGRVLEYSHFSPMMGRPDAPENYHLVTIELAGEGSRTLVTLSQDNNATEEARRHSEQNWRMMLEGLKKVVEAGGAG